MWAYGIRLRKDTNGTLLVTCPSFPEVTTFGEDENDSCKRALDAIEEAIAARIADQEPIPDPSRGRRMVALPAHTVAKVLLYRLMRERGVNKSGLARALNWHRPQVDRLLDLRHASRLQAIEEAFAALNSRLTVDVENAVR